MNFTFRLLLSLLSFSVFSQLEFDAQDSPHLSSKKDFRTMFWNIRRGGKNQIYRNSLIHNIDELVSMKDKRPDLIIFSEYNINYFPSKTYRLLTKEYPFYYFSPYSNYHVKSGFGLFSKHPLSLKMFYPPWFPKPQSNLSSYKSYMKKWLPVINSKFDKNHFLDCFDLYESGECLNINDCLFDFKNSSASSQIDRSFPFIELSIKEHRLKILPVHLINLWTLYRAHQKTKRNGPFPRTFIQKTLDLVEFTYTFNLSKNDPHFHQLLSSLKEFKSQLKAKNSIGLLLGDFNYPSSMTAIKGSLTMELERYNLIASNFPNSIDEKTFSFPTKDAKEKEESLKNYPDMLIDHAFSNSPNKVKSTILKIKGSDHYPVIVDVNF